jgi:exodeoxyribonuclease V beta subunit
MQTLRLTDIKINGFNLIEASAGTGKTWTIAALYIRLLLEAELKPEEVLVVTYTKAATSELKERIRQRIVTTLDMFHSCRQPVDEIEKYLTESYLNIDKACQLLTRALFSFDNSAIFTIHGFCQRALSDSAFESGSLFDTEMISDQTSLVQEAADDFWRKTVLKGSEHFVAQIVADRYTPANLLKPFKGHYQNHNLKIIPPATITDFESAASERNKLFRQVATIWFEEQDQITELLLNSGLNKNSYKPSQVLKASKEIGIWLRGLPSDYPDKLALFTTETLSSRTNKGCRTPHHRFFDVCQKLLTAFQECDDAFRNALFNMQHALHDWLKTELPLRKRKANIRCYDDLLNDLQQALCGENGDRLAEHLRRRYKAALIDEFQDTDPLQWQIFRNLANSADYPVFLIGDPKQAIYSFRGADIHAYLAAADNVADENKWTLETNRRSTSRLVEAVNQLFSSTQNPFLNHGIGFQPVHSGRNINDKLFDKGEEDQTPLRFMILPDPGDENNDKHSLRQQSADAVTTEIIHMLNSDCRIQENATERSISPGDFAVLVKTHAQADIVSQSLLTAGIRSVQYGSTTIFDTSEALELWRLLRAVSSHGNSGLVCEAMLGRLLCFNANSLDEVLQNDLLWDNWLEQFKRLANSFESGGIIAMTASLLDECGVRSRLLAQPDGERRLTNLQHCVELVHQAALESDYGIENCIHWLENRITGHFEDETALLRLETDDDAVRISTIHASKGLQYPIVFLPFAWDASARKPDPVIFHEKSDSVILDLGSEQLDDNRIKSLEEQNAEAVRLLYVALTRAEFRCYVVWGCVSNADSAPLYSLMHGTLSKPFKELTTSDIVADIQKTSVYAPGIQATVIQPNNFCQLNTNFTENSKEIPSSRKFKGVINRSWAISSFSSIANGQEKQLQPKDVDETVSEVIRPKAYAGGGTDILSIFDFPKGAAAGTCLHEIFEKLDFSSNDSSHLESTVLACLQSNGYDAIWLPTISQLVSDLLAVQLFPGNKEFSLGRLKPGQWKVELEFYLPLKLLNSSILRDIFSGILNIDLHGNFNEFVASLKMHETKGILIGFIDMVFELNGHYYIIDWKSNHLGNKLENYCLEGMRDAMAEHAYILQYHLYTLAVDRFLASRLPDYDYETHFGGIFYIFLRGIDKNSGHNGIYYDRPSIEFIRRANKLLLADDNARAPIR